MRSTQPRADRLQQARALTTRVLLICGALAAVQTVASLAAAPFTPALAAAAPPLYALAAGLHSVMPFLARLLTGRPWTATITAGLTGMLIWPFSAVGPLILVAFLAGAASFDLVLRHANRPSRKRYLIAVLASAATLFVISLPVFSPTHLVPMMVIGALIGRIVGEMAAWLGALALAQGLRRVGTQTFDSELPGEGAHQIPAQPRG